MIRLNVLYLAGSLGMVLSSARIAAQVEPVIAYEVPAGTRGNQDHAGPLGMDFDVNLDITIIRLGVFDSGSDGLRSPITARLFDRDTWEELASLEFTPKDPGDLIGGSRFKDLPVSLDLSGGARLTISADGYSTLEPNGNRSFSPLDLLTNAGGCSLSFVGSGRYGNDQDLFPATLDGGPADRYAAGTFVFVPKEATTTTPHGAVAYNVAAGSVGNQDFTGELGMDFDVNVDVVITRMGVFDDGSDGLQQTITSRLWDRDKLELLATVPFTPADSGEVVGGCRFKPLFPPFVLRAGFRGVISASGYGPSEMNGNLGFPGISVLTDNGGCVIRFVGQGRYSFVAGDFPAQPDGGPANRFAAGTFEFSIGSEPPPPFSVSVRQTGPRCAAVLVKHSLPIAGGEIGIAYDPAILASASALAGRDLPAGATVSFGDDAERNCSAEDKVARGLTAGWVNSLDSTTYLPPGEHEVLRLCFDRSPETAEGSCSPLRFVSCLGVASAPVHNVVTDERGMSAPLLPEDGQICILPETPFRRGDANSDGNLDISDPIGILGCLFRGDTCPACRDTSDANDDGMVDIADAVYLLQWRFQNGREPPPPLRVCGADPTADPLAECEEFKACSQ